MLPKKNDFSQEMLGNTHAWLTVGFSLQDYYNVTWTGDEKKKKIIIRFWRATVLSHNQILKH